MNTKVYVLTISFMCGLYMYIPKIVVGETLYIKERSANSLGVVTYKESFFGRDQIYIDDGSLPLKTFIDLKKQRVFLISSEKKHVTGLSLAQYMQMARNTSNTMFANLKDSDVLLKKGTESKIIRGYSCTELSALINQYGIEIHYWVASPPKGVSLENYFSFSKLFGSGLSMTKINGELAKRNVYPIDGWIIIRLAGRTDLKCLELRMLQQNESIPAIPASFRLDNLQEK